MLAVLFGVLAGALFGALAVASGPDAGRRPRGGRRVIGRPRPRSRALLALSDLVERSTLGRSGPSWSGALVPGASQILFILAVRDAGPSRAAILIGTAPLISVLIALLVLDEPFRPARAGTALIVAGGAALAASAPGRRLQASAPCSP